MTITIDRTGSISGTTAAGTDSLLALLHESLSAIEERDPDLLHSWTAPGQALVHLAALARQATAALGAEPGTCLTDGPGVVVVRDLVSATRLLTRAGTRGVSTDGETEVSRLVASAKGMHAALLEAMTVDV